MSYNALYIRHLCVMIIKDASNIKFSILGFTSLSYHWFWWKLDLSKWNYDPGIMKKIVILKKGVMTHASCRFWRILSHFCFLHTSPVDSPYLKTPVHQFSSIYNWKYIPSTLFENIYCLVRNSGSQWSGTNNHEQLTVKLKCSSFTV